MLHSFRQTIFTLPAVWGVVLTAALLAPNRALAANSGRQLFNVADCGAKSDGSALATDAFRQAIQAAKAEGGGTIYVPPGRYSSEDQRHV